MKEWLKEIIMEMQGKDKEFFKIPHALVDSGLLDHLKGSEVKTLLVIYRYAHYNTGLSYPTVKTIVKLSGVNKNCIGPATKLFGLLGLIEKIRTGKRFSFRNCYKVIRSPKIDLSIIPINTDKRSRYFKGKGGKFEPIPKNMDNNSPIKSDNEHPNNAELDTYPLNTDKKEKFRDKDKRDLSNRGKSAGSAPACQGQASPAKIEKPKKSLSQVTNETLLDLRDELGGDKVLKDYLLKQGYPKKEVEDLRL